jgi:hypothetical protein
MAFAGGEITTERTQGVVINRSAAQLRDLLFPSIQQPLFMGGRCFHLIPLPNLRFLRRASASTTRTVFIGSAAGGICSSIFWTQ